jgi:hypothetical protein
MAQQLNFHAVGLDSKTPLSNSFSDASMLAGLSTMHYCFRHYTSVVSAGYWFFYKHLEPV